MPLDPNFLNNSNFGRGAIHKAISIDTPHLGSAVASLFLAPENSCLRDKVFARKGMFAITSATFRNSSVPVPGAVGDLSLGSNALLAIQGLNPNPNTPPVPTATIAGEYINWGSLDANPNTGSAVAFFVVCHSDALRQSLTSTGWPALFAATGDARNDGLVSVTSELAGLGDDAGFHTPGFVHSADLTGFFGLGFTLPSVMDANTAISNLVVSILNTAVPEVPTFKNLGPANQ
jgi:hypothetical protein